MCDTHICMSICTYIYLIHAVYMYVYICTHPACWIGGKMGSKWLQSYGSLNFSGVGFSQFWNSFGQISGLGSQPVQKQVCTHQATLAGSKATCGIRPQTSVLPTLCPGQREKAQHKVSCVLKTWSNCGGPIHRAFFWPTHYLQSGIHLTRSKLQIGLNRASCGAHRLVSSLRACPLGSLAAERRNSKSEFTGQDKYWLDLEVTKSLAWLAV